MRYVLIMIWILFPLSLFSQGKDFNFSKGKDENAKENYNLAIYYFDLVIEEDSLFLNAYNERGLAKYNAGDYKGAMKDYQFVLMKDPENASAYFGMASVKDTWLNDKYGAISDYSKSIELSLKKQNKEFAAIAYFLRGSLKKDLGDENGYLDDLKKSAALGNDVAIYILESLEKIKNLK